MELGPPPQPSTEQTPSIEKKETKKSKKKDAEKLGAFAVEAKPRQPAKKAIGLRERLDGSAKSDKAEQSAVKNEQSLSDKAPELNGEAPLEHLSEVEVRAATQELAHSRRAELATELAEVDVASPDADQVEAAEAFLAKAEQTGDPDFAFDEALADLSIEPRPESDGPAPEDTTEETELAERPRHHDPIERVIDPHQFTEGELPLNYDETEEDDDKPTPTGPARPVAGGGAVPPWRPSVGSGIGGVIVPPPFGGRAFPNFNAPPVVTLGSLTNPNTISTEDAYFNERRAQLRGLLVGGIVGYLIGRRRGRIKTEKRLLPVQNKLEKEVHSLQTNLLEKEIVIRQAAAEKQRAALSPASEQLIIIAAEQKRFRATETQPAAFKLPSERIGHVLVSAERSRTDLEVTVNSSSAVEKQTIEKQVATMPRAELLAASEKIMVEGTTLRQIYETHLIGERGLRRLMTEHLSGGDVQRALRHELVEREIDYERDPILRDRARASLAGAGKSALNSLVQQAGAVAVVADLAKPTAKKADQPTAKVSQPSPKHRLADTALVGTIVVLIAVILFLMARGQWQL
jgi:hypothetical protein